MRMVAAVLVLLLAATVGPAQTPITKKVLVIGIDGCRPDAIAGALEAKHLHSLVKEGAFSPNADVLGERATGADTSTGPGWTSLFTGVWADKHGVKDNLFRGHALEAYPSFFKRIKDARPRANVVTLVSWPAFQQFLFGPGEGCRLPIDGDKKGYLDADKLIGEHAVKLLTEENPDALFVYFGNVDSAGHGYGFHPKSPRYTKEIETVDGYIGKILQALRARPSFGKEDWLIIVCTDHGGKGREHGLGEKVPEIRTGFLILHGPSVQPGRIEGKTFNVDVAATSLTHLGIPIQEAWKLDGKAVGLKKN